MTEQQINIGNLVGNDGRYELSVSNESPEDAAARRSLEAADAALKRRMSLGLFIFALLLMTVIFGGAIWVFAIGNADDKKWAAGIVSAIASGLVGFLVGQTRR